MRARFTTKKPFSDPKYVNSLIGRYLIDKVKKETTGENEEEKKPKGKKKTKSRTALSTPRNRLLSREKSLISGDEPGGGVKRKDEGHILGIVTARDQIPLIQENWWKIKEDG